MPLFQAVSITVMTYSLVSQNKTRSAIIFKSTVIMDCWILVQKNTPKMFLSRVKKNGRHLQGSHRGIPFPKRTDKYRTDNQNHRQYILDISSYVCKIHD